MNKKLCFAVFLALLAVSGAASAQHCTYIQGRPPLCWGAPQGGFVQQPLVQQQVVPAGISLPGGFSQCQLVGAIAGGTIGSLARNHTTQAVILAGLAGGLAGNYLCTNPQGQRVQVIGQQAPQTVAGQGVTVTRGQSQTTMFECNFNDGRPVILVARAEDCREFARQEVVQAPQQQGQARQNQADNTRPPTVRNGNTCALTTRDGRVIEDFFDSTRNQEGIEVPSQGAAQQCVDAIQRARGRETPSRT